MTSLLVPALGEEEFADGLGVGDGEEDFGAFGAGAEIER